MRLKDSAVVYSKWFSSAKTGLNKKEYNNYLHCIAEFVMNGEIPETLKATKAYKFFCSQDIMKDVTRNDEKWLKKQAKIRQKQSENVPETNQKQTENEPKTNEIGTDSEQTWNGFWGQQLDNEECNLGVKEQVKEKEQVEEQVEDIKVSTDNSLIPPTCEKKSLAFKNENEFQDYCREHIKGWYDEGLSKNEMNDRFNSEVKNGNFIRDFFPNDGRFDRHLHMFCNVWDSFDSSSK